jgi:DNA-binding MarR family transcriptional regulator/GNAT superfamily N-acetyltransferase
MIARSEVQMSADLLPEIDQQVNGFRRFNRFYTGFVGLLDEDLVQSGYSLTEARVLFELATRPEDGATEIADRLRVDPGYLSRILGRFEDGGLLVRAPRSTDARHSVLRLARKGKAAFADLNKRSADQARSILDSLTPAHRSSLLHCMRSIEDSLSKDTLQRAPFVLRSHRPGDMGWVVARHSILYAQEYGWDLKFEALVAKIVADFVERFDAERERCWIADRDGEPLGCIFLVRHPEQDQTAKLRLLLVEPSARGLGLGKALVAECLQFARLAGYRKVTLWTQSILHAAHAIYQRAGFVLVGQQPHHSFGRELTGQTWELDLTAQVQ